MKNTVGTKNYNGQDWFWPHDFRHYLRDANPRQRKIVHNGWLKIGVPVKKTGLKISDLYLEPKKNQMKKAWYIVRKVVAPKELGMPIPESVKEAKYKGNDYKRQNRKDGLPLIVPALQKTFSNMKDLKKYIDKHGKMESVKEAKLSDKELVKYALYIRKYKPGLWNQMKKNADIKQLIKKFKLESVNERMDKRQAGEMLKQLGGNKFIAMTGAKNFAVGPKGASFKIGRNSKNVNYVRIDLKNDLYDMEFIQMRAGKMKVKSKVKQIYADQLQKMFTKHTGMYTSL